MRISDWSSDLCSSDLELYCGPSFVPPDGIGSIAAMNAWLDVHDGRWMEFVPPQNPAFAAHWLARQKDMVEKYRPDRSEERRVGKAGDRSFQSRGSSYNSKTKKRHNIKHPKQKC